MEPPRRTNLSLVEPPEIRHALITKLREHLKKGLHHNFGKSLPCPYDPKHFAIHEFTQFNGMELFTCHECGYRYVMMKQDGEKRLINVPEKKYKLKRRASK